MTETRRAAPCAASVPARHLVTCALLAVAASLAAACGGADPTTASASSTESSAVTRAGTTASLIVNPSPALARAMIRISGCGYLPNAGVTGEDAGPEGIEYWGGTADAAGCLTIDRKASAYPGPHTLSAYQRTKQRGQPTLVARTSLTVSPAPLAIVSERYVFQWDATKACISEDDHLDWQAAGMLGPGETFTFSPRYPNCVNSRAVTVRLATDPGAQLQLSTVVPANDGLSNDTSQAGKTIETSSAGGAAALCMFPNTTFTAPAGYTITLRNVGTTAANVTLTGKDYNDWLVFYWSDCLAADADEDGWPDAYEHAMGQLLYPTGNYNRGGSPAGTDYLRACGTPVANDGFDTWPPDLDDDGVVTSADVAAVQAHVGEGNGIPWAQISPDQSVPNAYWNHVGEWNRFDLDADGWVTSKDVALVEANLGKSCGP